MLNFRYSNIKFMKDKTGNCLKVTGDLQNCMSKSFNAVAFRITIFLNNVAIAHTTITINGFGANQMRNFEEKIEDIKYSYGFATVLRCEIYPESAY